MKVVETAYGGYRFRSRLEARWAVFLDALNIGFRYEPEGFDLGALGWYLPDFWLPRIALWLEIKPTFPRRDEIEKVRALANVTAQPAAICHGALHPPSGDPWELAAAPGEESPAATAIMCWPDGTYSGLFWWCECPRCGVVGLEHLGDAVLLCDQCWAGARESQPAQAAARIVTAFEAARRARFEFAR